MRIACCVIGCRRTVDAAKIAPDTEFICQKHWGATSRHLRARYRLATKIARRSDLRFSDQYSAQGGFTWPQHERVMAADRLRSIIWRRLVATAIERAVGL